MAAKAVPGETCGLVLGDPGSGKTCFTKNEILAYCFGPAAGSWYEHHLPVYVSLSEAAQLDDVDDLFQVAATLAAKRNIHLPVDEIRLAAEKGQVALFFDGIDEVVSVGKRAKLVDRIGQLMSSGQALGNRFVLTSRPAAVEVLDLPQGLTTIRLSGLSETEMRTLASRILAMRVSGPTTGNLRISAEELGDADRGLVEQIMADCESVPGIKRIARNPLLLTLLVMVYANSGPPSAKRHRIYGQAVQTLASVRSRQASQKVFSEVDLRSRLSAVALKVFQDPIGSIPTLDNVSEVIASVMTEQAGRQVELSEARDFVQSVAEATGLLVIRRDQAATGGSVTFMHHSFLEYYAAIGLLAGNRRAALLEVATQPRWREVVILAAGILADTDDAFQLVNSLVQNHAPVHDITLDLLILALECALEGEVPSERILALLLQASRKAIVSGPGQFDSTLRGRLGDALADIYSATGGDSVASMLSAGLRDASVAIAAAFVDVTGQVAKRVGSVNSTLMEAFEETCRRREIAIRVEVLAGLGRAPCLRTEKALESLREAFSGSDRLRSVAARVVERDPGLAPAVWPELVRAIGDSNRTVGAAAAKAALRAGLAGNTPKLNVRSEFVRALELLDQPGAEPGRDDLAQVRIERSDVEELLVSEYSNERVLGFRLLPWVGGEEQFVYEQIMAAVDGKTEPEATVAALASLRASWRASRLLRVKDLEKMCRLLGESRRDVRIGAARVLGTLGQTTDCIAALSKYAMAAEGDELHEGLQALLTCGTGLEQVASAVFDVMRQRFRNMRGAVQADPQCLSILRAVQMLDAVAPEDTVGELEALILDFKPVVDLRSDAMLAYSRVARPTAARMNLMTGWLANPPRVNRGVVPRAARYFVRNVSRRLEYVYAVFEALPAFRQSLEQRYERTIASQQDLSNAQSVVNLREAIEEAHRLGNVYGEIVSIGK